MYATTHLTTNRVNDILPDLSDGAVCVLTGPVERDLFEYTSTVGHRTYAYDGHFWTGVEAYDGAELCSDDCLTRWAAEHMSGAVELLTDVEHHGSTYEVRTFLFPGDPEDGAGAFDAVAYPFSYADHHDMLVVCAVCGRVIVADDSFARFCESAVDQYVETALWSTSVSRTDDENEEPEPLDSWADESDIDPDTLSEMTADVVRFVAECWADVSEMNPGRVGHDFWLTRERHGAGFWDRGLGEVGDRLTDAARACGGFDLYVGDDDLIYGS